MSPKAVSKLSPVVQSTLASIAALLLACVAVALAARFAERDPASGKAVFAIAVGRFLAISTAITRLVSTTLQLTLCAVLAGLIIIFGKHTVSGSALKLSHLFEAGTTKNPLKIAKAVFSNSSTTSPALRILAFGAAAIVITKYILTATDVFLHASAFGVTQRSAGPAVSTARALTLQPCDQYTTSTTGVYTNPACGISVQNGTQFLTHPILANDVYRDQSQIFQIRVENVDPKKGVYLLHQPPLNEGDIYSYTGEALRLEPDCRPITTLCGMRPYASGWRFACPPSIAAGLNRARSTRDLNYLELTSFPYNNVTQRYESRTNPPSIELAGVLYYDIDMTFRTRNDTKGPEVITLLHGETATLVQCVMRPNFVDYAIVDRTMQIFPSPKVLTEGQMLALAQTSIINDYEVRAKDDVEDLKWSATTETFVEAYGMRYARSMLAIFSSAIVYRDALPDQSSPYEYRLTSKRDVTQVSIVALALYLVAHVLPIMLFAGICIVALLRGLSATRPWLMAEWMCTPTRILYQIVAEGKSSAKLHSSREPPFGTIEKTLDKVRCELGSPDDPSGAGHFHLQINSNGKGKGHEKSPPDHNATVYSSLGEPGIAVTVTNVDLERSRMAHLSSPVGLGMITGIVAVLGSIVLIACASAYGHYSNGNISYNTRIGLFLTATTIVTRLFSIAGAVLLPAVFCGLLVGVTRLEGKASVLTTLMTAAFAQSPLTIAKAYVEGRKQLGNITARRSHYATLAVILALVLAHRYALTAVDLYFQAAIDGGLAYSPLSTVPSNRALAFNACAREADSTDCGTNNSPRHRVITDPPFALEVYKNASTSKFQLRILDEAGPAANVYLLHQAPAEATYSYTGTALKISPTCKPVTRACNLSLRVDPNVFLEEAIYSCPPSIAFGANYTVGIGGSSASPEGRQYDQPSKRYSFVPNPIVYSVMVSYSGSGADRVTLDLEYLQSSLDGYVWMLMECQLGVKVVGYTVTMGEFTENQNVVLDQLTDSQVLALSNGPPLYVPRIRQDLDSVARKGNSTEYARQFGISFARAGAAIFAGAVNLASLNGSSDNAATGSLQNAGYGFTLLDVHEQTRVPIAAGLAYLIVGILPILLLFSVALYGALIGGIGSDGWVLAEWLCSAPRLVYHAIMMAEETTDERLRETDGCMCVAEQDDVREELEKLECTIGRDKETGAFGLSVH